MVAEVRNWFGDVVSHPRARIEARTVDDIVAVVRDADSYPAPVRPHGAAHSSTLCLEADGGTVIDMRRMNRILEVGEETVTVEAGALYIDVAKELEKRGLQFYVNLEIGTATMGSLACCTTKDSPLPGELGNASSYCVGMKLVTASGDLLEITDADAELMRAARSSFGLLGVVYEATFKIQPLQAMTLRHRVYRIEEFLERLPELAARGESMMWYGFPFIDRIAVEFRSYTGDAVSAPTKAHHGPWWLRNFVWKTVAPTVAVAGRRIPWPGMRTVLTDGFFHTLPPIAAGVLRSRHTVPTDQMVRFPEHPGKAKYTFSICAFPEGVYPDTVRDYLVFLKDYHRRTGFRVDLPEVGYRIDQDESSLLSYSHSGRVLTIDPISTGLPGWHEFLLAFNEFAADHGARPFFNQTWGITRPWATKAYGDRLVTFEEYRGRYDPSNRLLNGHFRELLAAS